MKKTFALLGACVLGVSLLAGCENACERLCDDLYSGSEARDCKDSCND